MDRSVSKSIGTKRAISNRVGIAAAGSRKAASNRIKKQMMQRTADENRVLRNRARRISNGGKGG